MIRKKIALFGGGPACLITAYYLNNAYDVHLFEKGKVIGRKFLVAGKGGFNLTNSLSGKELLTAYSQNPGLHQALLQFDSADTRNWLAEIGIETYVGSSGRIFPIEGIKPAQVLQRLKNALMDQGVKIHTGNEFVGFNENIEPVVNDGVDEKSIKADHYVFGLGGGSWSKTGANSKWLEHFNEIGVETKPFEPSNCGLNINWDAEFIKAYEGLPLKNISVSCGEKEVKGEALLTHYGIEGNAIYPIVPAVRSELAKTESAVIFFDFKPNNTIEQLLSKIEKKTIRPKNYGYAFNCDKHIIQLVKMTLDKEDYLNPNTFLKRLKSCPVSVKSLRSVEEAISTIGGVSMNEVSTSFTLSKHPNISLVGEMLDWDAPTGGFLLQGCFSTGVCVANNINKIV